MPEEQEVTKHIVLTQDEHREVFRRARLKAQLELGDPDMNGVETIAYLCERYVNGRD